MSSFFQLVFSKNPHIKKHFDKIKSLPENENFSDEMIFETFSKYKKYLQLFKNKNFNILSFQSFEKMEDSMHEIIQQHEVMSLCKSMLSAKYMNLVSNNSLSIFRSLIDAGLSRNEINPYLSKIKAFSKPEQFEEVLKKCYEDNISFDINSILQKIKQHSLNVEVAYLSHKDKILILKINDYIASNKLGSSSWCISYNKNYFERYTKKQHPKNKIYANQYFYYDFKLDKTHRFSMVGSTLTFNHHVFSADRFDRSLTFNEDIIKFIYKIHIQKFHNQSFLLKRFIKTLKGDSLESLSYIKEKINSFNVKEFSDKEMLSILICLERFKAAAKRSADNFYLSLLFKKYGETKEIPEFVINYFEENKPNLIVKLHYSGFNIQSKALAYLDKQKLNVK